jgi:hypothetical protein
MLCTGVSTDAFRGYADTLYAGCDTVQLRAMIGTMRADVRAEETYRHVAAPVDTHCVTLQQAEQRLRADTGGGEGVQLLEGTADGHMVRGVWVSGFRFSSRKEGILTPQAEIDEIDRPKEPILLLPWVCFRGGDFATPRGVPHSLSTTSGPPSLSLSLCPTPLSPHSLHHLRPSLSLSLIVPHSTLSHTLSTTSGPPSLSLSLCPTPLSPHSLSTTSGPPSLQLTLSLQVRCPVTLYVGNRDEHTADAGLQGWAAFTRGPCALQRLPGDHFYLEEPRSREALLRSLGQTLVHHLTDHPAWITMRGSKVL